MGETMKKLLLRWLKNDVLSEVRRFLSERSFKLPPSQVEALAKRFKVKPELLEMLNEELATRLANEVLSRLQSYLEKAGR